MQRPETKRQAFPTCWRVLWASLHVEDLVRLRDGPASSAQNPHPSDSMAEAFIASAPLAGYMVLYTSMTIARWRHCRPQSPATTSERGDTAPRAEATAASKVCNARGRFGARAILYTSAPRYDCGRDIGARSEERGAATAFGVGAQSPDPDTPPKVRVQHHWHRRLLLQCLLQCKGFRARCFVHKPMGESRRKPGVRGWRVDASTTPSDSVPRSGLCA